MLAALVASACQGRSADPAATGADAVSPTSTTVGATTAAGSTAPATPIPTTTVIPTVIPTTTPTTTPTSTSAPVAPTTVPSAAPTTMPALRTRCTSVVHIGDSTGLDVWDADDLGGDPAATLTARYAAVGVTQVFPDNSGGRSMVERLPGQENATEVAAAVRASGYRGCWVLMIGTNDAANVAAGGVPDLATRIAELLAITAGDPVLWVNAATRSSDPYYADVNMQAFNAALADAAGANPSVHVFDWASVVGDDWFVPDGVHYTDGGRAWRAALTARELALAFPG